MSLDNRPLLGRLPVRRGAFPRRGRARRRLDLPLPHVPEGDRQFLSPLVSVRGAKLDLDARRAEDFQSSNFAGAASAANAARR